MKAEKKLGSTDKQLTIEHFPTANLIPYARNSRTHSEGQIAQIAASIREFGFTNPVLVKADKTIIAGHGRVQAAQLLELETVPCIVLDYLSDTQAKALTLADNRIAMNSGWDVEMLSVELQELAFDEFNLDLLGFDQQELERFVANPILGETALEKKEARDPEVVAAVEAYTRKIQAPIYEPKGECPPIADLYDRAKCQELISQIDKCSSLSQEVKEFLIFAAYRHVVFDYRNIAEFYAHASKEVQELMENSALIIIDFNKAIENGFVVLIEELAEAYKSEQNKP